MDQKGLVGLGRVTGLFGVQGWVRIYSYTEPRENILSFQPLYVGRHDSWKQLRLEDGRRHGKGVIAKLESVDNRDDAAMLMGSEIFVRREQFPEIASGEYYWTDLEGLTVVNTAGVLLGTVERLIPTGAHDVLVVKGDEQYLIPFVMEQVVKSVELEQQRIIVAWESDY